MEMTFNLKIPLSHHRPVVSSLAEGGAKPYVPIHTPPSKDELGKVSFVLEAHGRDVYVWRALFPFFLLFFFLSFFFFWLLNLEIAFPPPSVCEGCSGFLLSSLFVLLVS